MSREADLGRSAAFSSESGCKRVAIALLVTTQARATDQSAGCASFSEMVEEVWDRFFACCAVGTHALTNASQTTL